jgi:hypothetical protein
MRIHNCEQGTEEWLRLRLGIPTASCFDQIITPKTAELSKSSSAYMHLLLAEWIGGQPLEEFENDWTRHGHEYESEARSAYEFAAGAEVQQVGFITRDDGRVGASPDGIVGNKGLCELKCPKANNHVAYLLTRACEEKYRPQLQGQLWVCEREWVDIQSYCPGFPTVVVRVARDEAYIGKLSKAVLSFVDVMMECRMKLTQNYGPFPRREWNRIEKPDDGMGISDADVDAILKHGISVPQS